MLTAIKFTPDNVLDHLYSENGVFTIISSLNLVSFVFFVHVLLYTGNHMVKLRKTKLEKINPEDKNSKLEQFDQENAISVSPVAIIVNPTVRISAASEISASSLSS